MRDKKQSRKWNAGYPGIHRENAVHREPGAAEAQTSKPIEGSTSVLDGLYAQERYVNEKEAGQLLGLSIKTLQLFRYEGRGPAYARFGDRRAIRYRVRSLLAWAAAREINRQKRGRA